ncbi:MAG TPA: hypothetical protein VHP38_14380 [Ruminiclostridium sp.]|nr:hypothetical protein [Ruminiclostridium sp.]
MRGSALENVTWKGNSQKMYKAIMAAVPSIFKSMIKHEVEGWLAKNSVTVVTEELLLKMFYEKAPKGYIQKIGPALEKMKTNRNEPEE